MTKAPLPRKGDKVTWETSQGETQGTVEKVVTSPTKVKGYCDSAWKKDPLVECAPPGGQNQAAVLTVCRAC